MILCTWAGFADTATDSALCASWWQAWGSVLAIVAAVVVAFVQHRQNLKAHQRAADDAHARALAAPLAIAEHLARNLADLDALVRQAADEPATSPLSSEILLQAGIELEATRQDLDVLNGIVVQDVPSYAVIRSLRRLAPRFGETINLLEQLYVTVLNRVPIINAAAERTAQRVSVLLDQINHEVDVLREALPQHGRGIR
ncbi:MAG: hypothetical protein J7603_06445 [Pseudacidovorax sp.]|nr:hypothetical protein [Pseudacidovorax sp.]